jgi:hypothetical protein
MGEFTCFHISYVIPLTSQTDFIEQDVLWISLQIKHILQNINSTQIEN